VTSSTDLTNLNNNNNEINNENKDIDTAINTNLRLNVLIQIFSVSLFIKEIWLQYITLTKFK